MGSCTTKCHVAVVPSASFGTRKLAVKEWEGKGKWRVEESREGEGGEVEWILVAWVCSRSYSLL